MNQGTAHGTESPQFFIAAEPVWPAGRSEELNLTAGFRTRFEATGREEYLCLRIAGATTYRLWINGRFAGHGPARTAHGHARVEEWDLRALVAPGRNLLAIEIAGYNVNSYSVVDERPFLQAELVSGGSVLAATGASKGFTALLPGGRVRKAQRFSFQRSFVEAYSLASRHDAWRCDADAAVVACEVEAATPRALLPRRAPLPRFARLRPLMPAAAGTVQRGEPAQPHWSDRSLTGVGPLYKGFPEAELEVRLSDDLQRLRFQRQEAPEQPLDGRTRLSLLPDSWRILDFGANLTGFIAMRARCDRPATLYLVFDELLTKGDVDFKRLGCVAAARFDLQPGNYSLETFEPYTLRYLKLIAQDGALEIEEVFIRELACDTGRAAFACSDHALNRIFEAGRQTFRQNAVDLFMDCPSRERAGWLCDSFFTARAEPWLTGGTAVEQSFLENFAVAPPSPYLPAGMFPMCYPSDQYNGNYIPNWALWLVLELEEYLARGGDAALAKALEPKVLALFDCLAGFRNQDGLLEKLKAWVFVEWSKANEFIQDVNYPTNLLYAAALAAAGRMYGRGELVSEAVRLRKVAREQSWDGRFFVDNSVREGGVLRRTQNLSEVCQYYAFTFGAADVDTHPELWRELLTKCSLVSDRRHPELHRANAFIGHQLRLDLLSRAGETDRLIAELRGCFLPMAEQTGTLWEHDSPRASCNHGFASHVAHILYRDVLGVHVDRAARRLVFRPPIAALEWCSGRIPLGEETLVCSWWRENGRTAHQLSGAPEGWEIEAPPR